MVLAFVLLLGGCAAEPYTPFVAVMLTESGGFSVEGESLTEAECVNALLSFLKNKGETSKK